jgi:hypothetical protein
VSLQTTGLCVSHRISIKAPSLPTEGTSNVGGIKITEGAAVSITYCALCITVLFALSLGACSLCSDGATQLSLHGKLCVVYGRSKSLLLDSHGHRWINGCEASLD